MSTVADAVIEYCDEDTGTVFRWHGGAYIDVGCETPKKDINAPAPASVFRAEDVINVWDDAMDKSTLELAVGIYERRPFRAILEAFEDTCRQYLAQSDDEDGEA